MPERGSPENSGGDNTRFDESARGWYEVCQPLAAGKRVLDVPCGSGRAASRIRDAARIVGLGGSDEAAGHARKGFPSNFVAGTMLSLPFANACFDVVMSLAGIERLFRSDVETFLAEAARVLIGGGKFAASATLLHRGKHSGNPDHLFEYTEANLRALLGRYFDPIEVSVREDAGTSALLFIGERRPVPLGDPVPIEPAVEEPFAPSRHDTLLDACFAVLLLDASGRLSRHEAEDRARMAEFILSFEQSDGSFPGTEAGVLGISDAESYEVERTTHFAVRALDALGARPHAAMDWLEPMSQPGAIEIWLESLDWQDIQRASERVTFVLDAMVYRAERERRAEYAGAVHRALDWLERKQDPATGLWAAKRSQAALVATSRLVALLEHAWRPVKSSVAIVDSTLDLEQPDPLLGPGRGGADQDLAAVVLLATMSKYTRHRSAEVRRALVRAYWAVWNAGPCDAADGWSTLARMLALGVVSAAMPDDVPRCGCGPLSWPGLGYFRTKDAWPAARRDDVRVWLRSGSVELKGTAAPLTVVITCYNLGRYLHEAVASVLEQTVVPERIVVVDDGSTDDFTNLLFDNWPYAGIELVRQRNAGVSAARNNAIRSAATEFICSMDADDRLHPEYFEKAVARIGGNGRLGFVSCYYRLFDCASDTYRYDNTRLPEMLVRNETCGISVFRKKAWEACGGYCEALTMGLEDWDLWIGMLEAGYEGDVIPEVLFDYRIRPGSRNRDAAQPANFERGCRLMAGRHKDTYERFAVGVVALNGRQFIELANLRATELDSAGRAIDRLTVQLAAEQASARALYDGRKWLEQQVEQWKRVAEGAQAELAESRAELAFARRARLGPVERAFRNVSLFAGPGAFGRARNLLLWMRIRRDPERLRLWNELFDAEWYAKTYPDVAESGVSAVLHYLAVGHLEGRKPSPRFEPELRGERLTQPSRSGRNPLVQSILHSDDRRSGRVENEWGGGR